MKIKLLILCMLASFSVFSQEDFVIQINDTLLEVSLDKEYNLNINGEKINFKISSRDTLIYKDEFFSFAHSKDYNVSKTTLEESIEQLMIMTAEGTGFLIQKYGTINPKFLNELMLNEVTKESINYGYKLKRADYKRKLVSGQEIEVSRAVLTYKGEKSLYDVATFGGNDEGLLIAVFVPDESMNKEGQKLIKLFWDSLKVNFK